MMALPRFFRRYLYGRDWELNTYEDLCRGLNPTSGMLSALIGLATCEVGGGKVLFGMPPGRQLTDQERAELDAEDAEIKEKRDPANFTPQQLKSRDYCSTPAMRTSVRPERRDGRTCIPIWILYNDGQWYLSKPGIFAEEYAYLQHHVTERLVTLDASEEHPQPRKWIEYTYLPDEKIRRFAEVKLYYEENLSFTIEVLSTREEPAGVRVSQSTTGWVPKG